MTAENTFRAMTYAPPVFLFFVLTIITAAGIIFPSVYFTEELTLVRMYDALLLNNMWLLPQGVDGLPTFLPGFFWFLRTLDAVPFVPDALFLPIAAFTSALMVVLGTYFLGRRVGLGARVSFAAGCMLLSCLGFVPLTHWVSAEVLCTGLLLFSLAFLYGGWMQQQSYVQLPLGFLCMTLAFMTGGLIALWIPLTASLVFLLWCGKLRRGHGMDAVSGFALFLLCFGGWLGAVIIWGGESAALLEHLIAQVLGNPGGRGDTWWVSSVIFVLALVPWVFIPLFVVWGRVLRQLFASIKASRHETTGTAWLWLCLGLGCVLCVVRHDGVLLHIVPLLPLAVLLLAKALLSLPPERSRAYFMFVAVMCFCGGLILLALSVPSIVRMVHEYASPVMSEVVMPDVFLNTLLSVKGLPVLGGLGIAAAILLYRFTNMAFAGGTLIVCVMLVCMFVQPVTLITGPSLAGIMGGEYLPRGMGIMQQEIIH